MSGVCDAAIGTLASRRLARLRPAAEWEACAGVVLSPQC
jgi:hypothetical protein